MNLLDYTKKLTEKIKLYDSIAKINYSNIQNPFAIPQAVTIIWIQDED